MKNLFSLLSVTMLLLIMLTSSECRKGPDPIPVPTPDTQAPSVPTGVVATATSSSTIKITWNSSTDNVGVVGYKIYRNGIFIQTVYLNVSYDDSGLSPETKYDYTIAAFDAKENTSSQSAVASATTLSPYTAVISSTGSYDASLTATDKVLFGRSVAKGLVLNVTTAGLAKIEVIGSLTNSIPAIGYYWINNTDNTDLAVAASTLNVTKVTITSSSFAVNLQAGINVICFKTVAYSGSITNGASVGLKVTGANGFTLANASYTADASYNVAAVQKLKYVGLTNVVVSTGQQTNAVFAQFQIFPYNDESATVYDGNLYPKISSYVVNTASTNWISPITNYSKLDFTNAAGSSGQNFYVDQLGIVSGLSNIFLNSNANYVSNILKFETNSPVQITKAFSGNYAWVNVKTNVFNPDTQFGPANVSWYHQSVKFVGNPETWIYQPNGNRIQ